MVGFVKVDLTSGLDGGTVKEQHQVERKEEVFRRGTVAEEEEEEEERRGGAAARSAIGNGEIIRVKARAYFVALTRSEMGRRLKRKGVWILAWGFGFLSLSSSVLFFFFF